MAKGSVYEGKSFDEAVRKGLEDLGLSRAEAAITVVEEGKGGFLGFGARPFRVSIMRRPGGAMREPEEKTERRVQSTRGRDDRRGGRSRERESAGSGSGGGGRDRGRGGRDGADGRRSAEEKPAARAEAPRAERPERSADEARPARGERRGGRDRDERREGGRDREERRPRPAPVAASAPPPAVTAPPAAARPAETAGGEDQAGDELRRRRRRGRRGGRGRRRGPEGAREGREDVAVSSPNGAFQEAMDHDDLRADEYPGPAAASVSAIESVKPPLQPLPSPVSETYVPKPAPAPLAVPEAEHAYAAAGHTPSAQAHSHESEPELSSHELQETSKRLTEDLLKAMGFEATVTVTAEGNRVDVTAEVAQNDDLLTGQKGEVRQAMQHLLNRFLNRGEGSRYHLQLEINDFWQRRETELETLARSLAEQALTGNVEMVTEYLNSQERRIVHVTLKEDTRVKTYALGTGMIKRVAIAPAGFPDPAGEEDAG